MNTAPNFTDCCTRTQPAVMFCRKTSAPVFRPLQLADRSWAAPLLQAENTPASNGCFGTLLLWGKAYGMEAARVEERLLCRYTAGSRHDYAYPSGQGSLKSAVCAAFADAAVYGQPLRFVGLTTDQKERLEAEFPGVFAFTENRDAEDYLYEPEKLATLSGRKLQSKRNHCNRFEAEQTDWQFVPLTNDHVAACKALFESWAAEHQDLGSDLEHERQAIWLALENLDALQLEGGVLFAGGRLVAFTIGELCGAYSVDVHFEKAVAELNGAYPMVNREYVRMMLKRHPDLVYINREEDLGLENLRKAKLSYQPVQLLKRYNARAVAPVSV